MARCGTNFVIFIFLSFRSRRLHLDIARSPHALFTVGFGCRRGGDRSGLNSLHDVAGDVIGKQHTAALQTVLLQSGDPWLCHVTDDSSIVQCPHRAQLPSLQPASTQSWV